MGNSKISAEQVVKNAKKLRNNLNVSHIKLKNKSSHRLPVDLTDVYTICVDCKDLIEQLLEEENWLDTAKLRKIISDLELQLFTHLSYHYKPLEKTLDKIYRQITTEKDIEDDLEKTLKAARRMLSKSKKKDDDETLCLKPNDSSKAKVKKTKKTK